MKFSLDKALWGLLMLILLAFVPAPPTNITVYLIGDSTLSVKERRYYPETGWGMPFPVFFDETVTVDNRAQNGRSTRTFIAENRWQPVAAALKPGDYVLIQFGHNDEVPTKRSYTPEADYKANLVRFITETRSKKATPVLLTPVAHRKFDAAGKVEGTHTMYSGIVRTVAQEQGGSLIDLTRPARRCCRSSGWKTRSCSSTSWLRASILTTPPAATTTRTSRNWAPAGWRSSCWPISAG
ncbi:rhamnogalacturonan acetylesterase [Hymenobacter psychrotolerans]|nr:rhamnogalacturonan acetylesterase [Hymenobacter psychrotolerans]